MRSPLLLALVAALAAPACLGYDRRDCDHLDPTACDQPVPVPDRLSRYRHVDRAARPPVGSPVELRNLVVTAVDSFQEGPRGNVGDVWVQERVMDPSFQGCVPHPEGGRVCGIQLFAPNFIPAGSRVLAGDIVNVSGGVYEEFDCTPCCPPPRTPCVFSEGRTLPELSRTSVERVGSARPPAPIPTTLAEIAAGGDVWMGILVRLTEEVTLGAPSSGDAVRGEIPLEGGAIKLTSQLTSLNDPAAPPDAPRLLPAGTRLRNLTGIVSYFFGTKIIPRTAADFEIVPP